MSVERQVNDKQQAFMDMLSKLIMISDEILMPDEICACAQNVLGNYAACHDDVIMNDPVKKQILEKLARECNEEFAVVDPLKMISKMNFDTAYENHTKKHEEERAKLKEAGKEGNELLEKVCESYRKNKEG